MASEVEMDSPTDGTSEGFDAGEGKESLVERTDGKCCQPVRNFYEKFIKLPVTMIWIMIGIVMYFTDVGSDVLLGIKYVRDGHIMFGGWTLMFVVLTDLTQWAFLCMYPDIDQSDILTAYNKDIENVRKNQETTKHAPMHQTPSRWQRLCAPIYPAIL